MEWLFIILFFVFLHQINKVFPKTFYRYQILSALLTLIVFSILCLGIIIELSQRLDNSY